MLERAPFIFEEETQARQRQIVSREQQQQQQQQQQRKREVQNTNEERKQENRRRIRETDGPVLAFAFSSRIFQTLSLRKKSRMLPSTKWTETKKCRKKLTKSRGNKKLKL
jgi:hypothetical protein